MTDYYYQDYVKQLEDAAAALRQAKRELIRSLNSRGVGDSNDYRIIELINLESKIHDMLLDT